MRLKMLQGNALKTDETFTEDNENVDTAECFKVYIAEINVGNDQRRYETT